MSKPKRSAKQSKKQLNPTILAIKILLVVLAILIAIAAGIYILIQVKLNEIGRVDHGGKTDNTYSDVSDETIDIEGIDWGEAQVATKVKGVVNILLVGQDSRADEERQRSDSMILFSVNTNSKELTMISFMRDLAVQIPEYGTRKLNAAYQYGGFELLDETLSQNFSVNVDYNVEVDFVGFKDIINTLGGIDLELTQEEADYINTEVNKRNKVNKSYLVEGVNHMTGQQALWYARTRHVGNSDFGRTQRQRIVLQKIFSMLKKSSWMKLLKVYDNVADNVSTDMTNTQILSIAFSAYTMGVDDINSYRIPATGMYTENANMLGSVLIPSDWDATRTLIHDYLYSDDGGRTAYQQMTETYGTQYSMEMPDSSSSDADTEENKPLGTQTVVAQTESAK